MSSPSDTTGRCGGVCPSCWERSFQRALGTSLVCHCLWEGWPLERTADPACGKLGGAIPSKWCGTGTLKLRTSWFVRWKVAAQGSTWKGQLMQVLLDVGFDVPGWEDFAGGLRPPPNMGGSIWPHNR